MQTPYRQIPTLLRGKRPFRGNSMRAEYNSLTGEYKVYSYETVIAGWTNLSGAWVSDDYYSVTTSRHQNLCRAWL